MAKKAKKPKLTEEEKERLEQCFRQVRDQKLREWYEQAHAEDSDIKAVAQARLQLQIWLREKRKEVAIYKQERDACKIEDDNDGLAAARKKLKHAQCAMAMHMKMSVEGLPESTTAKARKKWVERSLTLEELLYDFDLDKRTEFGVSRDSIIDPLALEVYNDEDTLDRDIWCIGKDLKDMLLEGAEGGGTTIEVKAEADGLGKPAPDPTSIWAAHALHMQERYRGANLPEFAIETKLAFQKKLFDQHVDLERQLYNATESTLSLGANAHHPTREGTTTTWNAVLVTTTFSEHSLWELSSPMLWRYFEAGLSWDYPQWVPGGVMRIHTVSKSSHIYFDFGMRTFSTQSISVPVSIDTRTLTYAAQCHQTGTNIDIGVTFLAQGFVKVRFPVFALIEPDMGCKRQPTTSVDLTGRWMGPVGVSEEDPSAPDGNSFCIAMDSAIDEADQASRMDHSFPLLVAKGRPEL
ncbi:hypothetical protein N0V90_002890 [Kalmusia sp. IMI 367209]|nr:hypothetical protein N0V90_002890 [Kalmusia sp. IMI 367209]